MGNSSTPAVTSAPKVTVAGTGANAEATGPTSSASAIDLNQKVSNVGQLKAEAPDVWNAMIKGIASSMINQFHDQSDRIVQRMKEAERDNER
jgi:hypothetical protein